MEKKKLEFLVPVAVSVLYFFTVKEIIPPLVYLFLAVLIGVYYFPIKLIVFINNSKEAPARSKIQVMASSLIFSIILFLSIINLYLEESNSLKSIIGLFTIINFMGLIYYYVIEKNTHNFILHFCFLVLISALLFV